MIIEFTKNDIVAALNIAIKAVATKTTSVILESVLITAIEGVVLIDANDGDLAIQTQLQAVIREEGQVVLNAKIFSDIVRKFEASGSLIRVSTEENLLTTIVCEEAKFQIMGLDPQEFIRMPYLDKGQCILLSQFALKEVIRQTEFSTAQSDINRMMGGELIDIKNNTAKFVTLDGHRISIRNLSLQGEYEDDRCVVPIKSLQEVMRILDSDSEKEVALYFLKNYILFEFDETKVLSRVMEGEYFQIENMLSRDYDIRLQINRSKFQSAIEQAMILIRENEHRPLIFKIEGPLLTLMVNSSVGTMNAKVSIEKQGNDLTIAFNPKFLADALKVIEDETVTIYFTNTKSPCYIQDDKNSYTYLILPVNFV